MGGKVLGDTEGQGGTLTGVPCPPGAEARGPPGRESAEIQARKTSHFGGSHDHWDSEPPARSSGDPAGTPHPRLTDQTLGLLWVALGRSKPNWRGWCAGRPGTEKGASAVRRRKVQLRLPPP